MSNRRVAIVAGGHLACTVRAFDRNSDFPEDFPVPAVIVTVPSNIPLTSPDPSTLAMETLLDDQLNSVPSIALPFRSNASATNCSVSPATTVSTAGETTTESTECTTDTSPRRLHRPLLL